MNDRLTRRDVAGVFAGASAALFAMNTLAAISRPPNTQETIERELGQPLLGYLGETPPGIIAFEYGNAIHVDTLQRNWISRRPPFIFSWGWTGNWLTEPTTTDAASAFRGTYSGVPLLFGQINDPEIRWAETVYRSGETRDIVQSPGFLVKEKVSADPALPSGIRFLNRRQDVVIEIDLA